MERYIERRRSPGQSRWRKPLRPWISRRRDGTRTEREEFVTQVGFEKKTAPHLLLSLRLQ